MAGLDPLSVRIVIFPVLLEHADLFGLLAERQGREDSGGDRADREDSSGGSGDMRG